MAKKPAVDVQDLPEELKIEIDSPLENFLTLAVLFHGLMAFLVSSGMYLAVSRLLPQQAMVGVYLICGVHGAFFAVLFLVRRTLRCYYLLKIGERKIFYVREFFGRSFPDDFLAFDDLEVITTTGIRKRTTRPPIDKWYAYTVCLLDKSGNSYEFSRESRDLEEQKKVATSIADYTGCSLLECNREQVVKASKAGNKVQVELVHLPIAEFSGSVLPFEASRQMINIPVIAGSFLFSATMVIFGTIFLLTIFVRLSQ